MNWMTTRLGDLTRQAGGAVRTGPFGSQLHKSDYVKDPTATPVVMPKDMSDGRIDTASIARVDDEVAERLSSHALRTGDIVLARRGRHRPTGVDQRDRGGMALRHRVHTYRCERIN